MDRPRNSTFTPGISHRPISYMFSGPVIKTPIVRQQSFQIPKRPVRQVVVTKPYEAQDKDELTLKDGEVFNLIVFTKILLSLTVSKETDKSPWGRGEKNDGTTGWFPMDCVYVIPVSPSLADLRRRESYKVDSSSITESKEENSIQLNRKLSLRPAKQELQNTNILAESEVDPALQAAQKQLATKKKGDFLSNFLRSKKEKEHKLRPPIALSKEAITFQDKTMDVGIVAEDEFEFKNYDFSKLKWKLESSSYNQPYILSFEPSFGSLAKGKTQKVKVKLQVKNLITRDVPISLLSSPGNEKLLTFIVRIKCGQSVFGVDPKILDQTLDDEIGVTVPKILVLMKKSLQKHDAFSKVGIFRVAGESNAISALRKKMDKKEFTDDTDIFSVSTLLKVWYRELPECVFSLISKEDILTEDPMTCFAIVDALPEPFHSLLRWIITLTYQVAILSDTNKMTIENLSIVISPNLYNFDSSINPSEGLVLTQKAAKFFTSVVTGYKTLVETNVNPIWKGPGVSSRNLAVGINTGNSPILRANAPTPSDSHKSLRSITLA